MSESATRPIVRFAVWLTFFNSWILFEETILDRYGFWELLPYYRVGKPCVWDLAAAALLGVGFWWLFRRRRPVSVAS